jgi:hypothetical protein
MGRAMFGLRSVGLAAALSVALASAAVASAPPQLRNKNITVSSTLKFVQRAPDGRIATPEVESQYIIYVSGAGRSFVRGTRRIDNRYFSGSKSADVGPGEKDRDGGETREMQFENGKLVGTAAFTSGAARMVVSFDPGFSRCSASIVFGKAGGAPIRMRGLDGVLYEIQSVGVTSQTCTIRDGNPFAK